MASAHVPEALAERLGHDATRELVQLFAGARTEWTEDVLRTASERFGSRLATEIASLRLDFGRELSILRQDMTRDMAALRQDMTTDMAAFRRDMTTDMVALRRDMTADMAMLRREMTGEVTALRQDMTNGLAGLRVEVLKWSFLFWIGQVAAMAGLLAFMLRT